MRWEVVVKVLKLFTAPSRDGPGMVRGECWKTRQQSGLVGWRVLYWPSEPCDRMTQYWQTCGRVHLPCLQPIMSIGGHACPKQRQQPSLSCSIIQSADSPFSTLISAEGASSSPLILDVITLMLAWIKQAFQGPRLLDLFCFFCPIAAAESLDSAFTSPGRFRQLVNELHAVQSEPGRAQD